MTPKEAFRQRLVETRVRFKRLSNEDLEAYLASGEWRGKAGGYAVQGLAGSFVVKIVGSYTNVVGLPLYETAVAALRRGLSGAFRLAERGVARHPSCARAKRAASASSTRHAIAASRCRNATRIARVEPAMTRRSSMNLALWLNRAGLSIRGVRRSAWTARGAELWRDSPSARRGSPARCARSGSSRATASPSPRRTAPDYLETAVRASGTRASPRCRPTPSCTARELGYILEHSGARVCFASRRARRRDRAACAAKP